jgi:putative FmdB family regulatory protein
MALYEYYCDSCKLKFEQITSSSDPDAGKCPKCQKKDQARKLVSAFRVGGQGDLRESTQHGCHGCYSGHHHGHKHDEDGGGE